MLTHDELLEGWEATEIVRLDPALIDGLELDDDTRRTLVEVGLPRRFEYFFTTVADPLQDPGIDRAKDESLLGVYEHDGRSLLRLGSDYNGQVCVDPADGRVIEVAAAAPRAPRINGSVGQFVACLLALRLRTGSGLSLDEMSEDELEAAAQQLRRQIEEIDSDALQDENGFWSLIVEQAEYGQL